jgi:hypothetical protein
VNGLGVTDIGDVVINDLFAIGLGQESRRWLQLIWAPGDLRSERVQPETEPRAFETGMTGYQHALTLPSFRISAR